MNKYKNLIGLMCGIVLTLGLSHSVWAESLPIASSVINEKSTTTQESTPNLNPIPVFSFDPLEAIAGVDYDSIRNVTNAKPNTPVLQYIKSLDSGRVGTSSLGKTDKQGSLSLRRTEKITAKDSGYSLWVVVGGKKSNTVNLIVKPAPVITIINPTGGEVWEAGKSYKIEWQSSNVPTVFVDIVGPSSRYHITSDDVPNTGYLDFTMPTQLSSNLLPGNNYRVEVMYRNNLKIIKKASSNVFSIKGEIITKSSITVLSPNGGEKWGKGKTYPIIWSSKNVDSVDINLIRKGAPDNQDNHVNFLARIKKSDKGYGNYGWTISNDIDIEPGNYYYIKISQSVKKGEESPVSSISKKFTITSPVTTTPTVEFTKPLTLTLQLVPTSHQEDKDSFLVGTTSLTITGDSAAINKENIANLFYLSSEKFSGWTKGTKVDVNEVKLSVSTSLPLRQFEVIVNIPTKELSAGSYVFKNWPTLYYGGDKSIPVSLKTSNSVSIIGETSPYITEIKKDPDPTVGYIMQGLRFDQTSNTVTVTQVGASKGVSRTLISSNGIINFDMNEDFGITIPGKYQVQVTTKDGASNIVWVRYDGVTTPAITASLSSHTPPSDYIVAGQLAADLTHIDFTGKGTITDIMLKRSGISDGNTLSKVYLYDGSILLNSGATFYPNGDILINLLSIVVDGTKTITIKADVSPNATSNQTVAVALTKFTTGGTGGGVNDVNLVGNLMSVLAAPSVGILQTPVFVIDNSTRAQTIVSSDNVPGKSLAIYKFVSIGGDSVIKELKFTASGTPGAVTSLSLGERSAVVINGVALFTGLNIPVSGGASGIWANVSVSYMGVGPGFLPSGSTAVISLTSVKYTSGGMSKEMNVSVPAPTMTLVSSTIGAGGGTTTAPTSGITTSSSSTSTSTSTSSGTTTAPTIPPLSAIESDLQSKDLASVIVSLTKIIESLKEFLASKR